MRKNYTNSTFVLVTILVAIVALCFGVYEYQREHKFRCDILHAQLQLNNYTRSDSDMRLTVIDTLGTVLYDSQEKNVAHMGNHLKRKEVQEALANGSGFDIKRESELNGEKYFYSATYFPEKGQIVRSSVPYSAPLTESLERDYTFFYYTAGILLLIGVVLYLRYRLQHSEQEKQRIKHQLTENAAHELKTPAASIEAYLETLVKNPDMPREKQQEFLERCYTQSMRMSSLLQDMSMITRLETAHSSMKSNEAVIDAVDIINEIISETRPQFEQRNLRIETSLPRHITLKADRSLLYSLFRNVIDNTFAYATDATLFTIKAEGNKGKYSFTFSDNGPGVPAEHLTHIFERFYRIDKGRSRRCGGTGLGLSIVKNVAMLYGGSATATTTPGGGLTINIKLGTLR